MSKEVIDSLLESVNLNISTGGEEIYANNNDNVNHPSHYTNSGIECIDEMELVFGIETVMHFCLCNVWKYRKRALYKNKEEDIKKSDWYMNKYKELKEKLDRTKYYGSITTTSINQNNL